MKWIYLVSSGGKKKLYISAKTKKEAIIFYLESTEELWHDRIECEEVVSINEIKEL